MSPTDRSAPPARRLLRRRVRRVPRIALLGLVLALAAVVVPDGAVQPATISLVKVHRAEAVAVSPNVVWILALGSDARPGQPLLRSRADAIQLVGINTRTGAASAIGIPRDSYVTVPGHGRNKINTGLYFGGPQLMAQAVAGMVGIHPDYVVVTGFKGIERMVNAIGGITVHSPRAFSDPYLKPKGFDKGRNKLRGYGAMAFARIRKSLPAGDFDRSANQQRVLRGIQRKIRQRADKPGFIGTGVVSVLRNLHSDLPATEVFELAQAIAQVDPRKVTTCVVSGGVGSVGAASVVFPDLSVARRYGDAARKDATIGHC